VAVADEALAITCKQLSGALNQPILMATKGRGHKKRQLESIKE
jgi:hypothetical protein